MRYKNYIPPRINRENGKIERHLPLANFIGPNTDIVRRVQEKVIPTTATDMAARKHDLTYHAIREKLRDQTIIPSLAKKAVRAADNLLIQSAEKSKKGIFNPVNTAHAAATIVGMKSKTIAEDLNIIDELKYVGKGKRDPLYKLRKEMMKPKKKKKSQTTGGKREETIKPQTYRAF